MLDLVDCLQLHPFQPSVYLMLQSECFCNPDLEAGTDRRRGKENEEKIRVVAQRKLCDLGGYGINLKKA